MQLVPFPAIRSLTNYLAMKTIPHSFLIFTVAALCLLSPIAGVAQSIVKLQSDNGQHQLVRNGQPYSIKGVGGDQQLPELAALGANSIRTWGTDNLQAILDAADRNGLTVAVGMWLGHERHGFDYQDEAAVLGQLDACLKTVEQFKDHPAVLLWGIGNEMEGEGTNPAVWYAVNHIAERIKALDPNHPTMTVIAELGDHKIKSIETFCPAIDIVGVNSYGGIGSLAARYRAAGGTKPYIVTEHGPQGPWEVGKTAWGAPLEESSTAKAARYAEGYRSAVLEQTDICLGSYAFVWGDKQETTATWFGMLLADGLRVAAADAMSKLWTGKPVTNRCPEIDSLSCERVDGLQPGEKIVAKLIATDPEGDQLAVEWVLRADSVTIGVGGDAQAAEKALEGAVAGSPTSATVTVPKNGGAYRLFAYVRDGNGGAAVANVPLRVQAPVKPRAAAKAELPVIIYADQMPASPYEPSGYMGNTGAIKMELGSTDDPHSGATCLRVEYNATDQWGGVLWQSPANDWDGKLPGGLDLSGAKELEFWARGANGGEVVNFVLGVIDGNAPYRDTYKGELPEVKLTNKWQRYSIPLTGQDLSRIKTGFGWSLPGQSNPVVFYLDNVRYVK